MKKYVFILLLSLILGCTCNAQSLEPIPIDQQQHFGVAYVLSTTITSGTYLITKDKRKSVAIGLMTTLLLAAGKEFYDSQGNGRATGEDFLAGALGAGLATITISITL